jgi:hypothetical protein
VNYFRKKWKFVHIFLEKKWKISPWEKLEQTFLGEQRNKQGRLDQEGEHAIF